jgi:hypothetical protein
VYRLAAIDGRYPLADAPAANVALWCRYRWVADGEIGDATYSLLRRGTQVCAERRAAADSSVAWDQPVTIPAVAPGEALGVSATIRRNVLGAVSDVFWRLDPVTIRVRFADGSSVERRIIPADAPDGIIVQPFLVQQSQLREFFGAGLGAPAEAVSFHVNAPWLYAPEISLSFKALVRRPSATSRAGS